MQRGKNRRKLKKMIIDDIKNSVRKALFSADKNIIVHFEKIEHTDFPSAHLKVTNFKIEPNLAFEKQKNEIQFELTYMKSENNTVLELLESETMIAKALLPVIKVNNKKLTLDDVSFSLSEKKLVMNFRLSFYTFEKDESETMQTLDITIKEDKNAR